MYPFQGKVTTSTKRNLNAVYFYFYLSATRHRHPRPPLRSRHLLTHTTPHPTPPHRKDLCPDEPWSDDEDQLGGGFGAAAAGVADGAAAASAASASAPSQWERRARLAEAEVQRLARALRATAPDVLENAQELAALR